MFYQREQRSYGVTSMFLITVGHISLSVLFLPWHIYRSFRRLYYLRFACDDVLSCPVGHRNTPAYGKYECVACGAIFHAYAFSPCPACGLSAGWVACEAPGCGLSIQNPAHR